MLLAIALVEADCASILEILTLACISYLCALWLCDNFLFMGVGVCV
jgi:hypothetical protein